jgi:hypothetical protein
MWSSRRDFIKFVVVGSVAVGAGAEWAELVLAGKPGAGDIAEKALQVLSQ